MASAIALQMVGEMLWVAVLVAAPVLGLTIAVGLLVSVIQVITQIQEVSLSMVPKLLSVVVVLVAFGPWMLRKLVQYSSGVISNIPRML